MRSRGTATRALALPAHALAFLLVVLPFVDFLANVYPPRFDELRWRYGAAGLFSGFLLTPLLGLFLAGVASAVAEQRRTLRVLGWLAAVGAVALLALTVLFGLDVLQLLSQVPAAAHTVFLTGALKAAAKLGLLAVWLLAFAWAAGRAAGRLRGQASVGQVAPGLVLGRPAGSDAVSERPATLAAR